MEWKELTKESLESLKIHGLTFWCSVKDTSPYYHIRYRIYLVSRVHNHPIAKPYWFAIGAKMIGGEIREGINDEDMLDLFNYYCIVNDPEIPKNS